MYYIEIRSNACDSMLERFDGGVKDLLTYFCGRFKNVTVSLNEDGCPTLFAIERDGDNWWEYSAVVRKY